MRSKSKKTIAQDQVLAGYARDIRKLCRRTAADVIKMGELLAKARSRARGGWLSWLERELGWSADTAENLIRVYEFSRTPGFRKIRNLPSPSVLYELAKKSIPEPARDMIVSRINAGERVKVADIKIVSLTVDAKRKLQESAPVTLVADEKPPDLGASFRLSAQREPEPEAPVNFAALDRRLPCAKGFLEGLRFAGANISGTDQAAVIELLKQSDNVQQDQVRLTLTFGMAALNAAGLGNKTSLRAVK
jgi:hypothetical protein